MKDKVITVLGSCMVDLVATVSSHPVIGETRQGNDFAMISGGKGANQAAAAARLGVETYFAGRVGNDFFAEIILDSIRQSGVKTDYLKKDLSSASGIAHIRVDDDGQNNIVMVPLANENITRADVDEIGKLIKRSTILQLQLEIPMDTIRYAMEKAKEHGTLVILNPAPALHIPSDMYSLIDILTPNESEAKTLTEVDIADLDSAKRAANVLLGRGVKKVIITMGSSGCLYVDEGRVLYQPAPVVDPIDTTAAGDAFNGGLAASLVKGLSIEDSLRYASAVAGLSVTRFGAQSSLPAGHEVEQFMQDMKWNKVYE